MDIIIRERERGDNGQFITLVPKVNVFLFVDTATLGDFYLILICWFIKLSVQTTNFTLHGNFVYHHWGRTSIYWPFSYPFRSKHNYPLFVCRPVVKLLLELGANPANKDRGGRMAYMLAKVLFLSRRKVGGIIFFSDHGKENEVAGFVLFSQ